MNFLLEMNSTQLTELKKIIINKILSYMNQILIMINKIIIV